MSLVTGWLMLALAGPVRLTGLAASADTVRITDDTGRTLVLARPPRRIVSLVPAATEVLFAIGAGETVVGRSRFDDEPPAVRRVSSVGNAIRPSSELVLALKPDLLILVGGSDNERSILEFRRLRVPALVIVMNTFADLERNIDRLGRLSGHAREGRRLARRIHGELAAVRRTVAGLPRRSVYYDVAFPPAFTIGAGSYLDSLISIAGGRNIFGDVAAPSPRVGLEAIVVRRPKIMILPVGRDPRFRPPAPSRRPGWDAIDAVRGGRVREVDADLLHRLGPRIGQAAAALAEAIHPEARERIRRAVAELEGGG
ncbi:MAG: helical backbone metal receptor [Gemmatimonadota bacterium]